MSEYVTDEAVEKAAKAMADDWNPERDPILTAMFRDYAATALEAAAPLIAAKALRALADDMEADSWDHFDDWGVPVIYPDALRARANRIARGES